MRLARFIRGCVTGVVLLLGMLFNSALAEPLSAAPVAGPQSGAKTEASAQSKRKYSLPRGDAATMLQKFAEISGKPVLFIMDKVQGEQTNAIHGEFSPWEALNLMLAGTLLEIMGNESTGGFLIGRRSAAERRSEVVQGSTPQPQARMKRTKLVAWLMALVVGLSTNVQLSAQSAPQSESGLAEPENQEGVVRLSPFTVTTQQEDTYTARDTLAGNRVRTSLDDVGSSVQVVTKKFLDDTNSKRAEDLLVLTANTEVNGQGGNFLGKGDGPYLTSQPTFEPITRVRGLDAADTTQNFFLTRIPFDSYNVGRVDLQRGPNSILFGIGKPGGIINATPNDAQFNNHADIENQVGSFGSVRFTADINHEIVPKQLAFRLSVLDDDTKYREDPAFRNDRRAYGALRWEPDFLNRGSAHTTLQVRAEHGTIDANMPMGTPPLDSITPYFTDPLFRNADGSLQTYHANGDNFPTTQSKWIYDQGSVPGSITAYEPNGSQGRSFTGYLQAWPDTAVAAPAGYYWLISNYFEYTWAAQLPFQDLKPYKEYSLSDPSIFNFYDKLIYGPNAGENARFKIFSADLAQTFFNGKAGLDISYNREWSRFSQWSLGNATMQTAGGVALLTIDIVSVLPDGSPNPNVGRPYVPFSNGGTGAYSTETRETKRLTAFAELDFRDLLRKKSSLGKALGRHVFTGLIDRYVFDSDVRGYPATYTAPDANNSFNVPGAGPNYNVYLGPSLIEKGSVSGADLDRVSGNIQLSPTTLTLWNNVEQKFVTAPLSNINNATQPDGARIYSSASLLRNKIDSRVITWQGYFLDGLLVPLFGYRTDSEDQFAYSAKTIPAVNAGVDVSKQSYKLPAASASTRGNSRTYSLVAHLPAAIRRHLPGEMDISPFINQSENFQPSAGRIDAYGNPLPDPKGKTREYGVSLGAFNQKFTLRITHFDTTVTNATLPGVTDPAYYVATYIYAFGQDAYLHLTNPTRGSPASANAFPTVVGVTTSGDKLYMTPPGHGPYSQAQIDAEYIVQQQALAGWATNVLPYVPESLLHTYGITNYNDVDSFYPGTTLNPNVAITSDTESRGMEYEVSGQPMRGLVLTANASHTYASVRNYAHSFLDFYNTSRQLFTTGPQQYLQMFRGYNGPGGAVGDAYTLSMLPLLNVLTAAEGRQSAEIRPWRLNLTGDYRVQSGRLKGLHFGGDYRWEDKQITGYPVITVDGVSTYDVEHPYRGSTNDAVDLWIGYECHLGKKILWKTQLNVRNVFARDKLEVVSVQPDGTPAGLRIAEPRVVYWTNRFSF